MKIINYILVILIVIFTSAIAQNYRLANYVVGNGAAVISNNNHTLTVTIGQPIIGNVNNPFESISIGFWNQYSQIITDVEDRWMSELPKQFELYQNYPNPFNPTTTIRYGLPKESKVKIVVYNILGEIVTTLVNDLQVAGNYEVSFDASRTATGIYIYRIQAGQFVETKKMVLMK